MRDRAAGIPLRAIAPNAVTALALCFGLTGVRFAIDGRIGKRAVGAILIAGVLDGIDGRIARLLHGESRFGAELDSLADVIAFGVAPALVLYLWSLQRIAASIGWLCRAGPSRCAARCASRGSTRRSMSTEQPHKSAGFLTGVPAPAGAGLALLPMYLWLVRPASDAVPRSRSSSRHGSRSSRS